MPEVLSYLNNQIDDLEKCACVLGWDSFDLKRVFPESRLTIFNANGWAAFGLHLKYNKPLNEHHKRYILSLLRNFSTITLLTIPKGLTLNKLIEKFKHVLPNIANKFGGIAVDHTYTIAISHSIIPGSDNNNDASALFRSIPGCRKPKLIEAAALIAIQNNSQVLSKPTLCIEKIYAEYVTVGDFYIGGAMAPAISEQSVFGAYFGSIGHACVVELR